MNQETVSSESCRVSMVFMEFEYPFRLRRLNWKDTVFMVHT